MSNGDEETDTQALKRVAGDVGQEIRPAKPGEPTLGDLEGMKNAGIDFYVGGDEHGPVQPTEREKFQGEVEDKKRK